LSELPGRLINMQINVESNVPKYVQIRRWILGMISRGKFAVGDQLPTEEELSREFGVKRMTVRQALDELVVEKMIVRQRGRGTILISDKPKGYVYELDHISSFNDDMEDHGFTPVHKLLGKEVIEADHSLADQMELGDDPRVIFTLSVKYVESEAVLIERSYIPYAEFSTLMEMDLEGPFYHLLVEKFNVNLHHSTQVFSAVLAGEEERRIFGFSQSEPCIFLESTIYDDNDIPVEVLHSHYRADRYRFKAQSGEYLFRMGDED